MWFALLCILAWLELASWVVNGRGGAYTRTLAYAFASMGAAAGRAVAACWAAAMGKRQAVGPALPGEWEADCIIWDNDQWLAEELGITDPRACQAAQAAAALAGLQGALRAEMLQQGRPVETGHLRAGYQPVCLVLGGEIVVDEGGIYHPNGKGPTDGTGTVAEVGEEPRGGLEGGRQGVRGEGEGAVRNGGPGRGLASAF